MKTKCIWVVTACVSLTAGFFALGESRGSHFSPAELLEQSTLVFKGRVLETETVEKYKVSFPTKASVDTILKGKWGHNEISFKHKDPGKNVVFPQEFNTPATNEMGTFYLQVQYEYMVLIGYIRETEPAVAR